MKEKTYPYVGIHEDDLERDDPMIILFTAPRSGKLLACNNGWDFYPIGYDRTLSKTDGGWAEPYFVEYNDQEHINKLLTGE